MSYISLYRLLELIITQLLIALSLLSVSWVGGQQTGPALDNGQWCPLQCDCFNYFETVDCSRRGLTTLPTFSYITRRLYLEGDLLEELPHNAFSRTKNLSVVILENNHIRSIDTSVFCGLPHLQEIDLSTNLLQVFTVVTSEQVVNSSSIKSSSEGSASDTISDGLGSHQSSNSNSANNSLGNNSSNRSGNVSSISSRNKDSSSTRRANINSDIASRRGGSSSRSEDRVTNNQYVDTTAGSNNNKKKSDVTSNDSKNDKKSASSRITLSTADISNSNESGNRNLAENYTNFLYESYDFSSARNADKSTIVSVTESASSAQTGHAKSESNAALYEYCRAPALKEINLSHNSLRRIPTNLSYFAPSLEILNLAFNEISSAALDSSFSSLTYLRYFDLSRNDIREIRATDFDPIRKLSVETISLADCGLVKIDPEAFRDMENLTSLTLSRSLVNQTVLEKAFGVFSPERNQLIRLDLSETYIRNLTLSLVGRFSRLVSLFVSYCDLEHVEPELFKRLPEVETLHLEGGQLTRLDNITSLKKLRRLNVKMNRLVDIDLSELNSLESVDLSYNQLDRLKAGWIGGGMEDLQLLNLSHNKISYIRPGVFDRPSAITTLDLSYNRMLDFPNLGSLKVSKLDLSHNGMRTIPLGSLDTLHQTLNELDLSYNDLAIFTDQTFLDFHLLQYFSLAHNRLGEALRNSQTGNLFDSLQLVQVLDLSYNGITVVPGEDLTALHHLNTLYLQGNMIRDLADISVDRTRVLAKLVLSSNRLHSIDVDILLRLDYLEEIDLSDNPFECSCVVLPFLRWANTTMVTLLEAQGGGEKPRYYCDFPPAEVGKSIFQRRPNTRDCEQKLPPSQSAGSLALKAQNIAPQGGPAVFQGTMTILVAIICSVAGLAGVGLICYFGQVVQRIKNMRYRWQIRYREVSAVETAIDHKL